MSCSYPNSSRFKLGKDFIKIDNRHVKNAFSKFEADIFWNLKYLRSRTLGCKNIEMRKSEFVAKTQFIYDL